MYRAIIGLLFLLPAALLADPLAEVARGQLFDAHKDDDQDDFKFVPPEKDPVLSAFMLPRGVVPSPKQMEALTKVRNHYEPMLRSAVNRMKETESEAAKLGLVKEIKRLRLEVRTAAYTILMQRPEGMGQMGPQHKQQANHKKGGNNRHRNRHNNHNNNKKKAAPKKNPAPKKPAARPAPKQAAPPKPAPNRARVQHARKARVQHARKARVQPARNK